MSWKQFILQHDGDDLARLALSRERLACQVDDFDLALTTLECRRKLRTKVPEWWALPSLRFPLRLSAEQCSSSATARYKASVALAACRTGDSNRSFLAENDRFHSRDEVKSVKNGQKRSISVADLTGGLGVDSWAFAQVFDRVLYNEMQPALAEAARHNFRELGLDNVTVQSRQLVQAPVMAGPDRLVMAGYDRPSPGSTVAEILGDFRPDILFLDPARRSSDGRKVFLLEDCQPDVLTLLPELLAACPLVMLKLSPMADITLVCKQLKCVKAVHVVAAEGECKELLLLLERGYEGDCSITVYENGSVLEVDQVHGTLSPMTGAGPGSKDDILFEPGKALLKAGAFDLPCSYGLRKIGQHTHLYVSEDSVPEALQPFGKCYQILEVAELNNRMLKEIGKRFPLAEVTARNIPLTSDQLRARMGVRSGGDVHIFGVQAAAGRYLLVCRRVRTAPVSGTTEPEPGAPAGN